MSRWSVSAGVEPIRGGRARLLLALAALAAQVWIAAPHVTRELVSSLAPPSQGAGIAEQDMSARVEYAAHRHDPAHCPICQASALARSGVTSAVAARSMGILSPTFVVRVFDYDHVETAPADPKTAPRAPPV